MNNRPENTPEPQHPPKSPLSKIRLSNAFYPILIGLGAVGYMLWKDFDIQVFSGITFSWHMVFWLVMAVVFMFGRDIGYIIRIRILSNNQLSWRQAPPQKPRLNTVCSRCFHASAFSGVYVPASIARSASS